ncbi:hypothetical protein GQ457_05G020080 [Hibiscus cannabinus]
MSAQIFPATAEGRIKQEWINCIRIFFNILKGNLKPKRIKDYLECKKPKESCFIKTLCRDLNQPRKSAQAGPVVSGRDIPFVIQLKQIIEAPR